MAKTSHSIVLALALAAAFLTPAKAQIVISEFLASNDTFLDSFGSSSDWVELHNTADVEVNLAGWSLTDEPDKPLKWAFGPQIMPAGGYLVVRASGKDISTGPEIHTNFTLAGDGEYLALSNPAGDAIQTWQPYPRQFVDYSMVRLANGSSAYTPQPTPGAANSSSLLTDYVRDTKFSVDRGFFSAPFFLTISTSDSLASIRYTLDGSVPTESTGLQYSQPLQITTTTVVRARAFRVGFVPTNTDTQTYIFPQTWISQPVAPVGFPASWGNPWDSLRNRLDTFPLVRAVYAMDTRVTADPVLSPQLLPALTQTLPVVCLTGNVADIFGTNGVYGNGRIGDAEFGVSVEYFDPKMPKSTFRARAGVQAHGAAVKHFAKKALRLDFSGPKADGALKFALFPGANTEVFDQLLLRTGGHDSFTVRTRGQTMDVYDLAAHPSYMRDAFLRKTENEAGLLTPRSKFVHLCINGLYWGLYDLLEKPNASWASHRQGGREDQWDIIHHPETTNGPVITLDGTNTNWNALTAEATAAVIANTPAAFESLLNNVGREKFIDHLIIRMWAGDHDWLGPATMPRNDGQPGLTGNVAYYSAKNWYAVRHSRNAQPLPWQFFSWDAEISMGNHLLAAFTTLPTGLQLPAAQRQLHFDFTGISKTDTPAQFWDALRAYPAFRRLVGDRVRKLLGPGGVLNPSQAQQRLQGLMDEIHGPMLAESARWGLVSGFNFSSISGVFYQVFNTGSTVFLTRDNHWLPEATWLRDSFAAQRSGILQQQFRNRGLYPTTEAPDISPPHGPASSFTLTSASPTAAIYVTLDGNDPWGANDAPHPSAMLASGNAIPLPSSSVTVKTRALEAGVWSALTETQFLQSQPAGPGDLVITELHFNPRAPLASESLLGLTSADQAEFLELTNLTDRSLRLTDLVFADGIDFDFGTHSHLAEIPPHGVLVIAADLTGFAARYGSAVTPVGVFQNGTRLANSGERLKLVNLAGTVIFEFSYDDTLGWPALADGAGHSMLLIAPGADTDASMGGNWRASPLLHGNPGLADPMSYAVWLTDYFSPTELAENQPQADPDGDGVPNVVEYLARTHPREASEFPLQTAVLENEVEFSYHCRPDATDYTLHCEFSPTLAYWVPQASEASPVAGAGLRRHSISRPMGGSTARFARLVAKSQPNQP